MRYGWGVFYKRCVHRLGCLHEGGFAQGLGRASHFMKSVLAV
ncbi:Unknown protein sequence [Pseudomonas syringae pv. maculicola]|nr:Unknown protein sequence [Pseudomonas syringae pv. maculicola]